MQFIKYVEHEGKLYGFHTETKSMCEIIIKDIDIQDVPEPALLAFLTPRCSCGA